AKRDPAAARKTADSGCRPSSGRQLRIFGLGGDENGDVGVGVFPESEENVVGGAGFGASGVGVGTLQRLRLKRVGAGEAETGERANGFVCKHGAMIEGFLELGGGFPSLMPSEIRLTAHINGMQGERESGVARGPQLKRSGGLKGFDGFGGIVAAKRELRANRW